MNNSKAKPSNASVSGTSSPLTTGYKINADGTIRCLNEAEARYVSSYEKRTSDPR